MSLSDLAHYRRSVDKGISRLRSVRDRIDAETNALSTTEERLEGLKEATILVQQVASHIQIQAHKSIAHIVSECLTIFDEPYIFRIRFDRKRGRTEARLTFEREGVSVEPMEASGGGVVDVAAFALRLSCLILSRSQPRKVLIIDEPFKHLSPEYRGRIRRMIEKLSIDLGVQFIMVTHSEQLRCGKVIHLGGER